MRDVCMCVWLVFHVSLLSAVVLDGSVEVEGESSGGADKSKAHCAGAVEKVCVHVPCATSTQWCTLTCVHMVCKEGACLTELYLFSPPLSIQTVAEEGRR